jgi:hypothetical protein
MFPLESLSILSRKPTLAQRLYTSLALLSSLAIAPLASAQAVSPTPTKLQAQTQATDSAWSSLTKAQQEALEPLSKHWNGLSEGQKRKWIAVAKTFPDLSESDRKKLHARMLDWAALSPRDREQARLNYAQTKSVTKADRAANWEAYQALSPEERKKFAETAKIKPVGAAVSVKPVAPDKLATVPVTRHTPESQRAAVAKAPLNRSTLLPQSSSASTPMNASNSGQLTTPTIP